MTPDQQVEFIGYVFKEATHEELPNAVLLGWTKNYFLEHLVTHGVRILDPNPPFEDRVYRLEYHVPEVEEPPSDPEPKPEPIEVDIAYFYSKDDKVLKVSAVRSEGSSQGFLRFKVGSEYLGAFPNASLHFDYGCTSLEVSVYDGPQWLKTKELLQTFRFVTVHSVHFPDQLIHTCVFCKAHMQAESRPYEYTESGFPNVWLFGIVYWKCPGCTKGGGAAIPHILKLHEILDAHPQGNIKVEFAEMHWRVIP